MARLTVEIELHELETQRDSLLISDEAIIKEYYDLRHQISTYTKDMRDVINHPNYSLPFMQPGRLVRIKTGDIDLGWGAVVNFTPRRPDRNQELQPQESYALDVLLPVAEGSSNATKTFKDLPEGIRPPKEGEKISMQVVPVLLKCLESISHLRIFLPDDLKSQSDRNSVKRSLEEVKRRFPDGIAVLDPIENMNITDPSFKKLLRVRFVNILEARSKLMYYRKLRLWKHDCLRILCTIRLDFPSFTINMLRR